MALTTRNRFSRFIVALYESAVPSRDCHVGRWPPRNDKPLVFAILTAACFLRRCSAGPGCPLPYNTACGRRWLVRAASAFPRLPRHFAPRNDTSGWCCGAPALSYGRMSLYKAVTTRKGHAASVRRQSRQRLRSDRRYTPYFGVYHFNGGRRYRVTFHFPLAHAMP